MIPIALARSCFCFGIHGRVVFLFGFFFLLFVCFCFLFTAEGNNRSLWESPLAKERAVDVLCRIFSA